MLRCEVKLQKEVLSERTDGSQWCMQCDELNCDWVQSLVPASSDSATSMDGMTIATPLVIQRLTAKSNKSST